VWAVVAPALWRTAPADYGAAVEVAEQNLPCQLCPRLARSRVARLPGLRLGKHELP
jgi:hypothetical protein